MANLNIEVEEELLRAIRMKCAEDGVMQKDWVPEVLKKAVGLGGKGGAVVSVRLGQDGAKRGSVQGVGEVEDEQLRGRVRKGRVQGGDKPKRVEEGRVKSKSKRGLLDPAEMVKLSSSEALRRMREGKEKRD